MENKNIEQSLKLNILSFPHRKETVTCSLYKKKRSDDFVELRLSEAPYALSQELYESNEKIEVLYTDFCEHENADYIIDVDLSESVRFAKHYYSHLIREYFKSKYDIISPNFIRDIEVWTPVEQKSTEEFNTFRVFVIKVQIAKVSDSPELVLYHQGLSRILKNSVADLHEINQDTYIRVVYNNEIHKYESLPEKAKYELNNVFPIVNKDLERIYEISSGLDPFRNIYTELYCYLTDFIKTNLDNSEFKGLLGIASFDFIETPEEAIHHTRRDSNYIQLGLDNKVKVFTPKEHLKEYGPCKLPKNTNVKFILIFHKDDNEYANKLYMYMNKIYKKPNGKTMTDLYGTSLYDYIRIKFDLDKDHSIIFEDAENPYKEIYDFIDKEDIDTNKNPYVAIYLSPYNKDEADPEKKMIYYRVKEKLLKHSITSQVIYKEHIFDTKFKSFYYANIASAILAKVGGIPWRLDATERNELVVGVGAFYSKEFETQFIGSAFSFSNNGEFNEFDCTSETEPRLLAGKIKVYIQDYVKKYNKLERLVIHFYKEMSYDDIKPIKAMLFDLGLDDLPVFIININKTLSKDYVAFDTKSEDLLPYSGTIINYAPNRYLLFNNTRYINADEYPVESYYAPLKLHFQCTHKEKLNDVVLIKDMIDQIYQFSRMYWKSVKQQNMPVTVKYPEMVARMFPYFENGISPFGRKSLWFL